ncbi:MAG: ATP synthase F0 subunit B, partial [Clostridia bacterium]|nr:ATP synthase F0 subunit B [Clostridia bacterium]
MDIISVNLWSILISLANLLIMFIILKKFLFKPVQKVFAQRQEQVDKIYGDAEQDRNAAVSMKQEYEARLSAAREEADGIVRNAVQSAQRRGDAIVAEASS